MPVGPYKEFGDCVRAQRRKGYSQDSARRICGQIEKNMTESRRNAAATTTTTSVTNNIKYEENDRFYIKAFLMDASENINQWGVHSASLDRHINSFIGKPLVLTEDFNHPLPQEEDDDTNPYNIPKVDDIVDHWLAYQENYRVGNIIDITRKGDIYYAIIEVTDPAAKEAFKNNDLPLFVSPAIAQLDPMEDPANISKWTGVHLAIVSNPAYTIKKALVTGQCHENSTNENDNGKCLLQLRQASVLKVNKDNGLTTFNGCGFCKTKALQRYAAVVLQQFPEEKAVNANSSFDFLESQLELTTIMSNNDNNSNNNNNNANNNNNNTAAEETTATTTATTEETKFDKVVKEKNPNPNPHKGQNIDPNTGQPYPGSTIERIADEVGIKVAGMEECVQIFTQNGVSPDQSVQICKLAAKALMENQNQQDPSTGGGSSRDRPSPGISGQFGSQIADYEKEIAKQEVKIGQLTEELKRYRKDDKTDAQRIAELEETVSNLHKNLKEKELEAYLVTKIGNEEQRKKKLTRFAELGMTLEDLKEIYEDQANTDPKVVTKKTASVVSTSTEQPSPISRVKLQVAASNNNNNSSDDNTTSSFSSEIKERNQRISSLLSKRGMV